MIRLTQSSLLESKRQILRRFTWMFILIGILVMVSGEVSKNWGLYVCKPMIMLALLALFSSQWIRKRDHIYWLVIGAMLFSLLGDICLMFEGGQWFLWGLLSFLLAHLCYIIIFQFQINRQAGPSLLRRRPWLVVPLLVYAIILLSIVLPDAGVMRVPVVIYSSVILGMVLSALNRWGKVVEGSFAYVFLGSMLFMISDSLIAIDRFADSFLPIPGSQFWIILTYMAAQYWIISGLLRQDWYLCSRK